VVRDLWQFDAPLIARIAQEFPTVINNGAIDRAKLRALAFTSPEILRHLEDLIYPQTKESCHQFIVQMRRLKLPLCILNVPLLFEVGWDQFCHDTIVVSAPAFLQRQRILSKPDMTIQKMNHVLSCQISDHEKQKYADYIVFSGLSKGYTFKQLNQIIRDIKYA